MGFGIEKLVRWFFRRELETYEKAVIAEGKAAEDAMAHLKSMEEAKGNNFVTWKEGSKMVLESLSDDEKEALSVVAELINSNKGEG